MIYFNKEDIILFLIFLLRFSGDWGLGIGDLGIGDWGLGIGDWAQSPIPNPQSPIPNPQIFIYLNYIVNLIIY